MVLAGIARIYSCCCSYRFKVNKKSTNSKGISHPKIAEIRLVLWFPVFWVGAIHRIWKGPKLNLICPSSCDIWAEGSQSIVSKDNSCDVKNRQRNFTTDIVSKYNIMFASWLLLFHFLCIYSFNDLMVRIWPFIDLFFGEILFWLPQNGIMCSCCNVIPR